MAVEPLPPVAASPPLAPSPPWRDVFKDPALLITIWITGQFFVLIVLFSTRANQMAVEAKQVILQTYVVAFTAAWGYWLGSSAGSKQKDRTIAANHTAPATAAAPATPPAAH